MTVKQTFLRNIRRVVGTQHLLEIIQSNGRLATASAPKPEAAVPQLQGDQAAQIEMCEPMLQRIMDPKLSDAQLGFKREHCPVLIAMNGDLVWFFADLLKYLWHTRQPAPHSPIAHFLAETPHYTWVRQHIRAGDTVIDCGANMGYFATMMGARTGPTGKVHAFEPGRRIFSDLTRVLTLNQMHWVTPVHAALSDSDGEAVFVDVQEDDVRRESSHLESVYGNGRALAANQVRVKTVKLDGYVAAHRLEPHILKIDVEGAEFLVLEGARQTIEQFRPHMCIEIHDIDGPFNHERLQAYLKQYGYTWIHEHKIYFCESPGVRARRASAAAAVVHAAVPKSPPQTPPSRAAGHVMAAPEDEMVLCNLNRMDLKLPAGLLRMYRNCLVSGESDSLVYMVESVQSDWICEHLRRGDLALDVGASGGIIAAAMAHRVGPTGKILAFEPARRALKFLRANGSANKLPQLVAVDAVVTDLVGQIPFSEYQYSNDDPCVFRPEASAITSAMVDQSVAVTYQVRATTLDEELKTRDRPVRGAKIDVEGFEVHVLRGARSLIETDRPYLCIDIHASPDKSGVTTEEEVRAFLAPLGYSCRMISHAMACVPQ